MVEPQNQTDVRPAEATHTVEYAPGAYCVECSALAEEYVWPCLHGTMNFGLVQKIASLLVDLRNAHQPAEEEFSAVLQRGLSRWELVGSPGTREHAESERADWIADGTPAEDLSIWRRTHSEWREVAS